MVKDDIIFTAELTRFSFQKIEYPNNGSRFSHLFFLITLIETPLRSQIFDSPSLYETLLSEQGYQRSGHLLLVTRQRPLTSNP